MKMQFSAISLGKKVKSKLAIVSWKNAWNVRSGTKMLINVLQRKVTVERFNPRLNN